MMHLGLSKTHLRILHDTLLSDHAMRVRVHSMDLNGRYDAELTDRVLDGQVDVDGSADVTRTCTLSLLDANRTWDFDSASPNKTALFVDRMIHVEYGVRVNFGSGWEWVDIPVFTGPITTLSRTGFELSVEAQGKEALAMGAVWRPISFRKHARKTYVIRHILLERAGETHFGFHDHDLKAQLPNVVSLNREDVPWTRAKAIAHSMGNRQLYYDGNGVCRLRVRPGTVAFTFDKGSILSDAQVSYSQENTINAVFVKGGVPKHGKTRITAEVFAPPEHPLSPVRLGRHGVHRYLMETVENTHVTTWAGARRVGMNHLRRGLAEGVEVSFDAMPVPHLEPGDMVCAKTDEGSVTFRLHQFSLPLVAGNAMSVGYNRNLRTGRLRGTRLRKAPEYWKAKAAQKAAAKKERAAQAARSADKPKAAARARANHPVHRSARRTPHSRTHR